MIHIVYSTALDLINFCISSKQQLQGVPASFGAKVQKVAVFYHFSYFLWTEKWNCLLRNNLSFWEIQLENCLKSCLKKKTESGWISTSTLWLFWFVPKWRIQYEKGVLWRWLLTRHLCLELHLYPPKKPKRNVNWT